VSKPGYALLQDVVMDADFPDLDLALRRGRHVDREDAAWYALLCDAQEQLELFYRRYGCELIHKTDGYFYLLPTGDKISRKQLSASDMLVGQALALLYLDPANVERGGMIAQEDLIAQLSGVLGTDALIAAFNPSGGTGKRKKYDERIAQRNVRNRVAEAGRRLASMGFVDVSEDDRVRLRPALMRFAEPVRGLSEPAEALAKLVAQGEVELAPQEAEGDEAELRGVESAEELASGGTPRLESAADGGNGVPSGDLDGVEAEAPLGLEERSFEVAELDEGDAPVFEHDGACEAGDEVESERRGESSPSPSTSGRVTKGQPIAAVHPMDRDFDWADILPEPEEPG
jgi:chromosome partition protein MukE